MNQDIEVYSDESPEAIMELIQWPLMELGIKIERVKSHSDHVTYRFYKAEPLTEQ